MNCTLNFIDSHRRPTALFRCRHLFCRHLVTVLGKLHYMFLTELETDMALFFLLSLDSSDLGRTLGSIIGRMVRRVFLLIFLGALILQISGLSCMEY